MAYLMSLLGLCIQLWPNNIDEIRQIFFVFNAVYKCSVAVLSPSSFLSFKTLIPPSLGCLSVDIHDTLKCSKKETCRRIDCMSVSALAR